MVHDMEVLHIEPSSLSAFVHGVVVDKVSPALLISWHADISSVLFLLPAVILFSCFSVTSNTMPLCFLLALSSLSILAHPRA